MALKRLRRTFRYAKILERMNSSKTKNTPLSKKRDYFVSFGLGMQNISGGGSTTAMSYALKAGYIYDADIFMTLAYQKNSSAEISVGNLYTSVDYIFFQEQNSAIYAGGVLGYSQLSKSGFSQSASIALGAEVGYKYTLYDYLELYSSYQALYLDHIIKLQNNQELKFNFSHTLEFGVNYKF